jgi:hypothetical protein
MPVEKKKMENENEKEKEKDEKEGDIPDYGGTKKLLNDMGKNTKFFLHLVTFFQC